MSMVSASKTPSSVIHSETTSFLMVYHPPEVRNPALAIVCERLPGSLAQTSSSMTGSPSSCVQANAILESACAGLAPAANPSDPLFPTYELCTQDDAGPFLTVFYR